MYPANGPSFYPHFWTPFNVRKAFLSIGPYFCFITRSKLCPQNDLSSIEKSFTIWSKNSCHIYSGFGLCITDMLFRFGFKNITQIQWGSEYRTSWEMKWSKNGSVVECIWVLDSPTIWIRNRWMPSCFLMYRSGIQMVSLFLNSHLGYPLNFIFVCHRHVMGGIPPPSRGIVGKNRGTWSKTTVRSKRVGPLGSNGQSST